MYIGFEIVCASVCRELKSVLVNAVQFCCCFVQFTVLVSNLNDERSLKLCKRMFPLKDVKDAFQACNGSRPAEVEVSGEWFELIH